MTTKVPRAEARGTCDAGTWRGSGFEGPHPLTLVLLLGGIGRLQGKVEIDLGVPPVAVLLEDDLRNQLVAGRIGEIVVQVRVAGQVDLRGQVAMPRCGNEEVDMRRALAVPAQLIEQLLVGPSGGQP